MLKRLVEPVRKLKFCYNGSMNGNNFKFNPSYSFSRCFSIFNRNKNNLNNENKFILSRSLFQTQLRTFAKKNNNKKSSTISIDDADIPEEIDLEIIEMQYQEVVEEFTDILSQLKFGSLSPDMIENLEVRAYGDICSMIELAQIIPKNEKTALVNVYDPSVFDDVKTCLDLCDLDLNIQKDA